MAINPPISENGIPLRVEGELLVLKRYDIETEIKIPQFGKKKGRGYVKKTKKKYFIPILFY